MKTFQLEILNLVRQEKLGNIQEFVQRKLRTRPRESVRIIETLLKQTARNDLVAVRNQFYNRNQNLDDLSECLALSDLRNDRFVFGFHRRWSWNGERFLSSSISDSIRSHSQS